jgi:hypothetical protein
MNMLGWFGAALGFFGVLFALIEMFKAKKMQRVPFHKPSDIAAKGRSVADEKGWVSTEGKPVPSKLLTAPLSGKQCLAYEVEIYRHYEKTETTEKGTETKKGSDKIETIYTGTLFQLTDGAGSVDIDTTVHKPDVDMKKTKSEKVKVGLTIPGLLQFGELQINTPSLPRDSRTVAFEATETVFEPADNLYAMGALRSDKTTPTLANPEKGLVGRLLLSTKGRELLLAHTMRNMKLGYAIGGFLMVSGSAFGIFGPKGKNDTCATAFTGATHCSDRIMAKDGIDYTWTVTTKGAYSITVIQPQVKFPIDGTITIFDSTNKQVAYNDGGAAGVMADVEQIFEPGTYRINVRDFARTTIKGGYSFKLDVRSTLDSATSAAAIAPTGALAGKAPSSTCEKAAVCCESVSASPGSCGVLRNEGVADSTCETVRAQILKQNKHGRRAKLAKRSCG